MSERNTIQVRDLRDQEWVWTSKSFLFHKDVDEKMYKVYSGLAAYADNASQEAYPSIATLSTRLNMGRSTVIRALSKLEELGFVGVDRSVGEHNIYSLLKGPETKQKMRISANANSTDSVAIDVVAGSKNAPVFNSRNFFVGVHDLKEKRDTPEAALIRFFLQTITQKYLNAPKDVIWREVIAFERYWTEHNSTGTKERWQTEKTFEVDRRLVTWFSKKKQFGSTLSNIKTRRVV